MTTKTVWIVFKTHYFYGGGSLVTVYRVCSGQEDAKEHTDNKNAEANSLFSPSFHFQEFEVDADLGS